MPTIDIPDIWVPSPENIKALPLALRRYIEELQKERNPDGVLTQIHWTTETYRREIDRLSLLLRKAGIDPSKKD
jgi:hypothetical protein